MPYSIVQMVGGVLGVVLANAMFDLDAVTWSPQTRTGVHLWFAEAVAAYGLVLVIFMLVRNGRGNCLAGAVAAYIGAA